MRDVIIVGLVGLAQELVLADKREPITGVLFGLLVISAITRTLRTRDVVVLCTVGLVWESWFSDSRSMVTMVLFALPPFNLLLDTLAGQHRREPGGPGRIDWTPVSPHRLRQRLLDGISGLGARLRTRTFIAELVAIVGMLGVGIGTAVYVFQGLGASRQIVGQGALSYTGRSSVWALPSSSSRSWPPPARS